jgi:GNAT superfamily N-acetyltransferase
MKGIIHPRLSLRWTDVILARDLTAPFERAAVRTYLTIETVLPDAPLARLDGLPESRSRERLDLRRRRGDTCVLARQGKRIVAFAWLAAGPWKMRDAGLEFRLDPTEVVVYDLFTAEGSRGQGVMQHVIRRIAELAKAQGRLRLYARAGRDNASSIAALERAQFVQLASIDTLRVCFFVQFHTIDIVKGEDSFYQHARRHLRATRPGTLRWRRGGTGMPVLVPTEAGSVDGTSGRGRR